MHTHTVLFDENEYQVTRIKKHEHQNSKTTAVRSSSFFFAKAQISLQSTEIQPSSTSSDNISKLPSVK